MSIKNNQRLQLIDLMMMMMMGINSSVPVIVAIAVVILSLLAWKLTYCMWFWPKRLEKSLRDQGFLGNPYRWITGDLVQMGHMAQSALSKPIGPLSNEIIPRIMPFVHHVVQIYGTKSFIWYGRRPRVNITEPEMLREIFSKWEIYQKESPGGGGAGAFGLVMREGQNWTKVRKILNPAFHLDKLKSQFPVIQDSCERTLKKWEEIVEPQGTAEIDVWSSLSSLSADVIARVAFGTSYEEGKRLFKLQDEFMILSFQELRSVGNYIPGWKYIPTKFRQKKMSMEREIRDIVMKLIEERKQSWAISGTYKDDLFGMMLDSNEKEIKEHGSGMTLDDVIQECKLFHLAGEDTTAALLTWTMILLSQHQDWQTKAREEVIQRYGKDQNPDFEGLNHLKIVTMIINESLRFYPPVTSLSRILRQNTKMKQLSLLHGTEISLPTILVHRDPKVWGQDANEFNPGRFSEGVSNATKIPGSFIPFGGGPRVCIGQNFALVEAKLALAKIVQRFSFDMSPSYVHAPRCLVSLEPQFGAPLILRKI